MLKILTENDLKAGQIKVHKDGVYTCNFSFNSDHVLRSLGYDVTILGYGVCDNYNQALEEFKDLIESPYTELLLFIDKVVKANEPAKDGWRWHKWGPYIGDKTPTCEYLYDEPKIDEVYCFDLIKLNK